MIFRKFVSLIALGRRLEVAKDQLGRPCKGAGIIAEKNQQG